MLLGDTQHDEQREERYAAILKRKEADGLIFSATGLPKEAASLIQSTPGRAPIVNGCEFNPELGIPSVAHRQRQGRLRRHGSPGTGWATGGSA